MIYRVEIADSATVDLRAAYDYIAARSAENAARWQLKLLRIIETLERFPEGCGLAPENEVVPFEVRQKFFGAYRILFTIEGDRVIVLHIRHGARLPIREQRINPPPSGQGQEHVAAGE